MFAAPGLVAPIQTATNTVGKHIEVPKWPGAIALTPNGKTLYAASNPSNTVTPIRTATNKPGKAIKVGKGPPHRDHSEREDRLHRQLPRRDRDTDLDRQQQGR